MATTPTKIPIDQGLISSVVQGIKTFVTRGQFATTNSADDWFGPQDPIQPVAPVSVTGRQFDYPVGYNIITKPRAYEPVTFEQLRALSDNLDILRLVIETRKDLVCKMRWEIKPKDETQDKDARCKAIEAFLAMPDKEHTWSEWLRMIMEDMLVIDAATLYPRMTKGGQLYALEPLDGATVVRKLDAGGRTPLPTLPAPHNVAYQQFLKGVPAVDYTRDELIYRPRNVRTNKVYGFSPVEQIIMTVNIALRRQTSQLQWYTEGSTPDLLFGVPSDWTPDQIKEMNDYFNMMLSGDTAARRKATFVPGGISPINTKDGLLKDEYDEWLARIITYAFSVTNSPFVKQLNRATADNASETQVVEGLTPYLNWIADLIDYVLIKHFGAFDLHLVWIDDKDPDPVQDATVKKLMAETNEIDIRSGVMDINEVRVERGLSELTPEQLEERKPKVPVGLLQGAATPGQKPETDDDPDEDPTDPEPTEKLEKKKSTDDPVSGEESTPIIDRGREELLAAEERFQQFLSTYLHVKGLDISAQIAKVYGGLAKADSDPSAESDRILAQVVINWNDLEPEAEAVIGETAKEGVKVGIEAVENVAQITLTETDATKLAFTRAENFAKDRAAELVGMKWVDGELVPNPNAKWVITDSTRELIKADVIKGVEEGWSVQMLSQAIQKNVAFSPERAAKIAQTELAMADTQGNKAAFIEAKNMGVALKWEWFTAKNERVCPVCRTNHEAVREIGEPFPSGHTETPAHPLCRCALLPVVGEG